MRALWAAVVVLALAGAVVANAQVPNSSRPADGDAVVHHDVPCGAVLDVVASAGHETGPGSWAAAGLENAVAAAVGNQAEIGFFKGAFFFVKDQFNLVNILIYAGGLVVIVGLVFLMGLAFLTPVILIPISAIYAVAFAFTASKLRPSGDDVTGETPMPVSSGVLYTLSYCTAVVGIYGVLTMGGRRLTAPPKLTDRFWLPLEVLAIFLGFGYVSIFQFPFITLPMAIASYGIVINVLDSQRYDNLLETARTLVIFGPTMMAAGALMNHTLTGTGYDLYLNIVGTGTTIIGAIMLWVHGYDHGNLVYDLGTSFFLQGLLVVGSSAVLDRLIIRIGALVGLWFYYVFLLLTAIFQFNRRRLAVHSMTDMVATSACIGIGLWLENDFVIFAGVVILALAGFQFWIWTLDARFYYGRWHAAPVYERWEVMVWTYAVSALCVGLSTITNLVPWTERNFDFFVVSVSMRFFLHAGFLINGSLCHVLIFDAPTDRELLFRKVFAFVLVAVVSALPGDQQQLYFVAAAGVAACAVRVINQRGGMGREHIAFAVYATGYACALAGAASGGFWLQIGSVIPFGVTHGLMMPNSLAHQVMLLAMNLSLGVVAAVYSSTLVTIIAGILTLGFVGYWGLIRYRQSLLFALALMAASLVLLLVGLKVDEPMSALFNGVNALSAVAPRSVAIVVAAAIAGVVFWEVLGGKVLGGGVIEYDPTAAPLLRDATLRVSFAEGTDNHGLLFNITGNGTDARMKFTKAFAFVEGDAFWDCVRTRVGSSLVWVFLNTLHPVGLCPNYLNPGDVGWEADAHAFAIQIGTGRGGTQRVSHATLRSSLENLQRDHAPPFSLTVVVRDAENPSRHHVLCRFVVPVGAILDGSPL